MQWGVSNACVRRVCCRCQVAATEEGQAEKQEEPDPQWKQIVGGGFTQADEFCVSIRRLQQRTGCSDAACQDIIETFRKYLRVDVPADFAKTDKKMQKAAGTGFMRLHGCIDCKRHVFKPEDKCKHCPRCDHARFNSKRQPFEEVFYFPLKPKLQSLLRLPAYRKMCQHEFWRQSLKQDENLMSDVYDSPEWKKFMGPPVHPTNRIGKWKVCFYFC